MAALEKVLFVDDEPHILATFSRNLRKVVAVDTAEGPEQGLVAVRERGPFAVVISDLKMPGMDGITFLEHVRELAPDTVRIILTGHGNYESAISAVNRGAVFRFLTKPTPPEVLLPALRDAINQYKLITAERELLRGTLRGSVQVLMDVLSLVSPEAINRSERFKDLVLAIGRRMKEQNLWQLDVASMLCQLGCVGLSEGVTKKMALGEDLSPEEEQEWSMYPSIGQGLLVNIPRMEGVSEIIGQQLQNVSEKQILGARILRVVLDYDMQEARGMEAQECLRALEMRNRKESCYDAEVLDALRKHLISIEGGEVRKLRLGHVEPGMLMARDYLNSEGTQLLKKGQIITEATLARLKALSDLLKAEAPMQILIPAEDADDAAASQARPPL